MISTHPGYFSVFGQKFKFRQHDEADRRRASAEADAFQKQTENALTKELGRTPTLRELAQAAGERIGNGPYAPQEFEPLSEHETTSSRTLRECEALIADCRGKDPGGSMSADYRRAVRTRDFILSKQAEREQVESDKITRELITEQRREEVDPNGDTVKTLDSMAFEALSTGRGGLGWGRRLREAREAFEADPKGSAELVTTTMREYRAACEGEAADAT